MPIKQNNPTKRTPHESNDFFPGSLEAITAYGFIGNFLL
jgi:hypothetical protein